MSAKRAASPRRPSSALPGGGFGRTGWTLAILLVLAALVLRIVLVAADRFPSVDGVFYMDQARRLLTEGRLVFSTFPPGWPLFMTIPLLVLGVDDPLAPLRAAQFANVALGTALGGLVWLMLRADAGRRLALAGAAVVLLLPLFIKASAGDMSDVLYACVVVAVWLLDRRGRALATGLLLGYAYLIRPEALLIAGGLALLAVVRDRRVPWRLLLGFALFFAPYVLFVHAETGRWALSSKSVVLERTLGEYPGGAYRTMILDNLRAHLPNLVGLLGLPAIALAAVGAVVRPGRWLIFVIPGMLPVFFSIPMMSRFWLPMAPFLLIGAVRGGRWLLERLPESRRRLGVWALVGLVLAGTLVASLDEVSGIGDVSETYEGLRDAGLRLRPHVDADTRIAEYKPYASFWAGCGHLRVPADMPISDVIQFCQDEGAGYIVVNVFVARTFRPALLDLLDRPLPSDIRDEVEVVEIFDYPDSFANNTVLFRIQPRP